MKKIADKKPLNIGYNIIIESIDKYSGKVIKRITVHNTIVNGGLNLVRNLLAGDSINNPLAIALGTDDTAVQVTDIALGVEVERETATITKPEDYKVRYEKVFSVGSGVSYTIKELGIFDSVIESGSTMFARANCNNTLDSDTDLSVKATYTMSRV